MRVVCEHCQTVYNIPDAKLTRDVSQATCKVCQQKIVIRKTPADPRAPAATPTAASAQPAEMGETELSNSWREAIVDNRQTVQMLKNMGVRTPGLEDTASGPPLKLDAVPANSEEHEPTNAMGGLPPPKIPPIGAVDGTSASGPPPVVSTPSISTAVTSPQTQIPPALATPEPAAKKAPPTARVFTRNDEPDRGASALLSGLAALAAAANVVFILHGHVWAVGLSGLAGLGATSFVLFACLLNALVRRRGIVALLMLLVLSGAGAGMLTAVVVVTGGQPAHALAEAHPFLRPLTTLLPNSAP